MTEQDIRERVTLLQLLVEQFDLVEPEFLRAKVRLAEGWVEKDDENLAVFAELEQVRERVCARLRVLTGVNDVRMARSVALAMVEGLRTQDLDAAQRDAELTALLTDHYNESDVPERLLDKAYEFEQHRRQALQPIGVLIQRANNPVIVSAGTPSGFPH